MGAQVSSGEPSAAGQEIPASPVPGRVIRLSLLGRFALLTVAGALFFGVVLTIVVNQLLQDAAIRRAKTSTSTFVQKQAFAHLSPELFRDEPSNDSILAFSRFFREEIESPEVLRIKVWDRQYRVIFSDQRDLIGQVFPDNHELREALAGEIEVEIGHPVNPENRLERGYGQLMEVYVPITLRQGQPVDGVIEVYYVLDALNNEVAQLQGTVAMLLGVAILAAVSANLAFFRRWVAQPLRRLGAFAREVGRGNLVQRIGLVRRDEIGELAAALNAMAAQLEGFYVELREAAVTDRLTGVYNRRYFHEFFDKELARARRYGWSLAVLMIDVDRLKFVNDNYSHERGDEVLRRVGQILEQVCRASDVAVRWGGDEFVLVLPQTDAGQASLVADRIRVEMARGREAGLVPEEAGLSIGVGVGVGSEIPDDLVHQADVAMYREKRRSYGMPPRSEPGAGAAAS